MQSKKNTAAMLQALQQKYGDVPAFLTHKNPFELLIAVILSVQTTDLMVNKVTPDLFAKYPTPFALKNADIEELERLISRINYYKTKAKNIKKTAQIIDEIHKGKLPDTIAKLTELPGVGRKVANVIMAEIHKIPEGIVVDTHVKRVSYRIGWTNSQNPVQIEKDLMQIIPKSSFINIPKHLILIGRNYCFPKNPDCPNCPLNKWCEKRIKN